MSYRRLPLILALNAILLFAGCEKQPIATDEPVAGEQKVAFAINADCTQTRTTNDGLKTEWAADDALTVFYKHNGKYETAKFTYSGEGSVFTGEVYTPDEGCSWIAEYPYNAGAKAPTAAAARVDAVQVQDGYGSTAHLAGPGFPLTGSATYSASTETPQFAMSQVLSQCRFKITNGNSKDIIVTSIEFTAPVAICGEFTTDLTAAAPVWTPSTERSSCTVRLDVSDGTALAPEESAVFSLGMMPFSVTDGEFKIAVHATCDGRETVSEKTVTKSMTFAANTIGKINYTFEASEPVLPSRYILVTAAPADWSGTYLILNDSDIYGLSVSGSSASRYDAPEITDNYIVSTDETDAYAVTFTKRSNAHPNDSGNAEYDLQNKSGSYIYCSSSSFKFDSSQPGYSHTLTFDNGVSVMSSRRQSSSTKYYLRYSSNAFSYSSSASASRVHLYKYVEEDEGNGGESGETGEIDLTEKDLGSFNLVNSTVQPYLTAAAAQYDDEWNSSIVSSYPNGGNGDLNDRYSIGDSHITAYDKPAPVTIPLTGWNGTQVSVTVYNNQARTDVENSITATVANDAVDFYNLIPGRTYWYTVTANASEIARGHFVTTGDRRLMKVSDAIWADRANNCRDFGGLKGMNNKTVKYNLLFRGSNMNEVTAEERDILLNYMGISLDVDLRATSGSQTRNVASNPLNVNWSHEGISGGSDLIFNSSNTSTNNTRKNKVKNIFTAIFDSVADGEAVYIHCFAGADRTGYVCCVLEAVLGVSEKDCSIDYELTSFSCVHTRDRNFKVKGDAAMATCYPYLKGLSGSTFQDKAITYLKSAGITDAQIQAFQNAMLE